MRRIRFARIVLAALVTLAAVAPAGAASLTDDEARKIINERSCNACHEVDETRLGPAFRTVGLRYKTAEPGIESWLATKIREGGAGSWGNVPMVSYPKLPPDEARALARWILDLGTKSPPAKP